MTVQAAGEKKLPALINRIYELKCARCGNPFENKNITAKWCPACKPIIKREIKHRAYLKSQENKPQSRTMPWHFTGSGGMCDRCNFVSDCMALQHQLWFTPYCMPIDHNTDKPNRLHRFWEGE